MNYAIKVLHLSLGALLLTGLVAGKSMTNHPIEYPQAPMEELDNRVVEFSPKVTLAGDGKATMTFKTMQPTPSVAVYYGVPIPGTDLDYPKYHQTSLEDGTELKTSHSVVLDIKRAQDDVKNSPHLGRIDYRLEIYLPKNKTSRYIDGQFNYDTATFQQVNSIIEGPFVNRVNQNSAVISWVSELPGKASVYLGSKKFVSVKSTVRHEIMVKGLLPGIQYEYYVENDSVRSPNFFFHTAAKSGENFRFVAMGDSRESFGSGEYNYNGVNHSALRALGTSAFRQNADFILFFGALASGQITQVENYHQQMQAFKRTLTPIMHHIPVYTGMGNNELMNLYNVDGKKIGLDKPEPQSTEILFADEFVNPDNGPDNEGPGTPPLKETCYYFDWGNCRFIMLNNNYMVSDDPATYGGLPEGGMLNNQLNWLKQVISDANKDFGIKFIIAGAQEPVFPNGSTQDAMWYNGGDTNHDSKVDGNDLNILETRNELWAILSSSPKMRAFITGDEHNYSRLYIDDHTPVGHKINREGKEVHFQYPVYQITSGGAGAPYYEQTKNLPWSENVKAFSIQNHYLLFDATARTLIMSVIGLNGEVLDKADLTSVLY